MEKIRVLIVDDEPLAREGIRMRLQPAPDIEIIGECRNGREAVAAILRDAPELVFLDIQMPRMDGFAVIEAVGAQRMPQVIFVTAYDEHALRAFEVHALDYLLKPIDGSRFAEALARARDRIRGKNLDDERAERRKRLSRTPVHQIRRTYSVAGRRRNRLDRSRRQLCAGACRASFASVAVDNEQFGNAIESATIPAHSSLDYRQSEAYQRTASDVSW
jgi:two-component system LytT family response regulator